MKTERKTWSSRLAVPTAVVLAFSQTFATIAQAAPPTKIGPGEGVLNIVAWEGYAEDQWVKPFEAQTGCKVNRKYAGSSDEMVTLMRFLRLILRASIFRIQFWIKRIQRKNLKTCWANLRPRIARCSLCATMNILNFGKSRRCFRSLSIR